MTWANAKEEAEAILRRWQAAENLRGRTVRLAEYEDEKTYDALHGVWTLSYHRMVMGALTRELKRRGAKIEFVKIGIE